MIERADPELPAALVAIWVGSLNLSGPTGDRVSAVCSPQEFRMAARLRVADARRRRLLARGMLRYLLADLLGVSARQVPLATAENGKPFVRDARGLQFNASHSADLLAVAVTSGNHVGIDIQYAETTLDPVRIAARVLSADDAALIRRLPAGARNPAFYAMWTRKEACLKACGCGLRLPPSRVHTGCCGYRTVRLPGHQQQYGVTNASAPAGLNCAVAVAGGRPRPAEPQRLEALLDLGAPIAADRHTQLWKGAIQ